MPTDSGSHSSFRFRNGLAIDPLWLHVPKAAMMRDLPYPAPVAGK